jgi:hypothetical protein
MRQVLVFLAVGSSKANITLARLSRCCLSTPGGWVDQAESFLGCQTDTSTWDGGRIGRLGT